MTAVLRSVLAELDLTLGLSGLTLGPSGHVSPSRLHPGFWARDWLQ